MSSLRMIAVGLMLLLAGFLLPFLMVLRVLDPSFVLSFFAHFSSVVGLLTALYGIFDYAGASGGGER